MKTKNLVLAAVMTMAATILFAQHTNRAAGMNKRLEYMKKALSLTDDQASKVKAIQEKYGAQFKTLRSDSTSSRENKTGEMKKLMEAKNAELKTVLTETQYAQWDKLKQEHQARIKGTRGDHQRLDADHMKTALSLSDDQYAKFKAIETKFVGRYKTLKVDSTVAREAVRAEWKKLSDEKNIEIKGILTPDQYTKWNAMQADRRKKKGHHGDHKGGDRG